MTLTASGALSLSQINVELGRSADYTVSFHDSWMLALTGNVSATAGSTISLSNFFGKSGQMTPFLQNQQTTNLTFCNYVSGPNAFFNGTFRGLSNTFSGSGGGQSPYVFSITTNAGSSYLGPILITCVESGVSCRFVWNHATNHGAGNYEDDWASTTYPANFLFADNSSRHYKIQPTT